MFTSGFDTRSSTICLIRTTSVGLEAQKIVSLLASRIYSLEAAASERLNRPNACLSFQQQVRENSITAFAYLLFTLYIYFYVGYAVRVFEAF